MASFRPFPPHSSFPPPPNQSAPPRGNQYNQNWGYPAAAYGPPRPPPPQYSYPPPPPPPESSYPPPPPPPYYYGNPPPPPASPPPASPPPPPPPKEASVVRKLPAPPPAKKPRPAETEEQRRARKKRELEKHHRSSAPPPKSQPSKAGQGSIAGSRMADRRSTPFLAADRVENRLKKPTTFLCKLKFRNELPDPSAQPKLMSMKRDKDQYSKYTITSLEKAYKPKLFVDSDLGIPLDLLDLSVYNPPSVRPPLDPEDEELLRDDEAATPVKKDGIKRKERPTDKGVAWLVKTQYISPLSTESAKQSLTEKQAKDLRESRGGNRGLLENRNNRDRQIKDIQASFEACKSLPIHATNKNLYPEEVFPLLPDFDRYEDQFVLAAFDNAPTADSETYGKFDQSTRDAHESQAILKSYKVTGSDPGNPEKFLAYMVPSPDELSKDIYDEHDDVSYSWVREYHWDVRGDDAEDPTTYLVSFDESEARYLPLPTKLVLRKKRAKEGRSNEEVEHFPVPSRVTVRNRPTVSVIELEEDPGFQNYSNTRGNLLSGGKRGGSDVEDDMERSHKMGRHEDIDDYSGAEDEMSD